MTHLPTPELRGSGRLHLLAWILVCNTCQHECLQDGTDADYATYVPDGWESHPDGTHTCSDCLSRAATGHTLACLAHPADCMSPAACAPVAVEVVA